jgi:hypothetical protein
MEKSKPANVLLKSFSVLILACLVWLAAGSAAWSEERWKASFDDICSKVDASGSLSAKELTTLIERVDKLLPEIQGSSEPSKKIYLQRLKKCRAMYQFMIDSKQESGK